MYRQANNRPIYTNFTKKGKEEFKNKSDKMYDDLEKMNNAKKEYVVAKTERKTNIKNKANELNRNASTKEKLFYNNATRKLAAKYIVDNDMSVEEATKKAKTAAWRNTAILTAAYGAYTVATIAAIKKG